MEAASPALEKQGDSRSFSKREYSGQQEIAPKEKPPSYLLNKRMAFSIFEMYFVSF